MRPPEHHYIRTLSRAAYQEDGIGINDVDAMGTRRIERIHQRLIRDATHGLARFDDDGAVVLRVDPANLRERGVSA